jgi:hypothetical protein
MQSNEDYLRSLQDTEITWIATRRDRTIFEAIFQGEHVMIRMNDFSDEPIYTVFLRGEEIDIEESPKKWHLQLPS